MVRYLIEILHCDIEFKSFLVGPFDRLYNYIFKNQFFLIFIMKMIFFLLGPEGNSG